MESFGIDNSDLKGICRWSSGPADPGGWLQLRPGAIGLIIGQEGLKRLKTRRDTGVLHVSATHCIPVARVRGVN